MNTGENQQAIRKIIDLSRFISVGLLLLHFYRVGYPQFIQFGLSSFTTDWILVKISLTGLFASFNRAKYLSILFLLIAVLGSEGKKEKEFTFYQVIGNLSIGAFLFLGSGLIYFSQWDSQYLLGLYILICTVGYLWLVRGLSLIKRIISKKFNNNDIFN
ncbi:MAG: YWFCY domain-containing protein, partial [Sphingobacterium sp.]